MTSNRSPRSARQVIIIVAAIASLAGPASCATTSCKDIGLEGPKAASPDAAFDAFLMDHYDATGQRVDRSHFERTPAEGSTGEPDDRVAFDLADSDPGSLPAREFLVATGPDGSWQVLGGCV